MSNYEEERLLQKMKQNLRL